jgi:Zn-dependent peptidase ImmA (M78 family)
MKQIFFFILGIAMSACSFNDDIEYRIDPQLKPHIDFFLHEATKRDIEIQKYNLVVTWDDLDSDVGGDALKMGYQRVIRINIKHKNNPRLRYIVMHECGHILLNRKHCTQKSIMNPIMKEYILDDKLIDELFNH